LHKEGIDAIFSLDLIYFKGFIVSVSVHWFYFFQGADLVLSSVMEWLRYNEIPEILASWMCPETLKLRKRLGLLALALDLLGLNG
jgi:hypothetical protein